MRIIAGSLGGRTFASPHGHRTHPMSDKIKGALFNILGDLHGLSVLDAFSGSGALSFEAISRGADSCLAIENDRLAQRTISENIRTLGLQRVTKLVSASAQGWYETNPKAQFDIVLLDPPYDHLQQAAVEKLFQAAKDDGIVALSWPGAEQLPNVSGFECSVAKSYGDAQLAFYQRV